MQPAITLSFATYAELQSFIESECARRQVKHPLPTSEAEELGNQLSLLADAVTAINNRLKSVEILGGRHIEDLRLLNSTVAKVVETNVRFNERIKQLEEDGVQEWAGELPEPTKQEAA